MTKRTDELKKKEKSRIRAEIEKDRKKEREVKTQRKNSASKRRYSRITNKRNPEPEPEQPRQNQSNQAIQRSRKQSRQPPVEQNEEHTPAQANNGETQNVEQNDDNSLAGLSASGEEHTPAQTNIGETQNVEQNDVDSLAGLSAFGDGEHTPTQSINDETQDVEKVDDNLLAGLSAFGDGEHTPTQSINDETQNVEQNDNNSFDGIGSFSIGESNPNSSASFSSVFDSSGSYDSPGPYDSPDSHVENINGKISFGIGTRITLAKWRQQMAQAILDNKLNSLKFLVSLCGEIMTMNAHVNNTKIPKWHRNIITICGARRNWSTVDMLKVPFLSDKRETCLMVAARLGRSEIVRFLVEYVGLDRPTRHRHNERSTEHMYHPNAVSEHIGGSTNNNNSGETQSPTNSYSELLKDFDADAAVAALKDPDAAPAEPAAALKDPDAAAAAAAAALEDPDAAPAEPADVSISELLENFDFNAAPAAAPDDDPADDLVSYSELLEDFNPPAPLLNTNPPHKYKLLELFPGSSYVIECNTCLHYALLNMDKRSMNTILEYVEKTKDEHEKFAYLNSTMKLSYTRDGGDTKTYNSKGNIVAWIRQVVKYIKEKIPDIIPKVNETRATDSILSERKRNPTYHFYSFLSNYFERLRKLYIFTFLDAEVKTNLYVNNKRLRTRRRPVEMEALKTKRTIRQKDMKYLQQQHPSFIDKLYKNPQTMLSRRFKKWQKTNAF